MISSLPKWMGDLFGGIFSPNMSVIHTSMISPNLKLISFQGDISQMNFQIGYASVIRVSETEYRNYTVANYDLDLGTIEMVFHLHGNGPGSKYIESLQLGDEVFISRPRGRNEYDQKVKPQFFFGDETSLGQACAFLPRLKHHHQFQFYFELDQGNEHAPELLGLENFTVFPKNGSFNEEKWVGELPVFQNKEWQYANFVLTGNVKSVRTLRKIVKTRTKGKVIHKGYWLEGAKGL